MAKLGTVRHQSVRTEDVTKAYIDLESRLKSKQTLAERLRGILASAKGEVQELVAAEAHLAGTLEEIERLKGEIRYYDNLTGFATVILKIAEKDLGLVRETVAGSWSGFLWSVKKMFVGASLSTPWLILGFLGWLLYRRWRRKEAVNVEASPQR